MALQAENTMYVIGGVNAHDEQLDDVYILSLETVSASVSHRGADVVHTGAGSSHDP